MANKNNRNVDEQKQMNVNSSNNKGKRGTNSKQCDRKRNAAPYNNPKDKKGYDNDVSWYSANGKLLSSASQFNFTYPMGTNLTNFTPYSGVDAKFPGLMTLETMPSLGLCKDPSSPVNIAMNAQYSFIRHANSGHANYDAPDLMLYTLAMSSVYSYINYLIRVYGTIGVYSQKNRYFPNVLLQSQYVDPQDAMINRMNLYNGILLLIQKAASFFVPGNMNYFKREAFMYTGLYTEGSSIKDQMYAFVPFGFYKYGLDTTGKGCLKLSRFHVRDGASDKLYKVSELIEFGNNLLKPLIGSEDIGIMSGDILKAYSDGGVMKLAYPDFNYTVTPTFNITVLEQFKNACILKHITVADKDGAFVAINDGTPLVIQDLQNVTTGPYLESVYGLSVAKTNTVAQSKTSQNMILTTTSADPGLDIVVENSRLLTHFKQSAVSGDNIIYEIVCGTELVVDGRIWTTDLVGNPWYYPVPEYFESLESSALPERMVDFARCTVFNFKPLNWYILTDLNVFYLFGAVDNFALLSYNDLYTLDEATLVNLFNVPTVTIV